MMKPISFYFHFPFCVRKCNYCDFVSYSCDGIVPDLLDYYLRELDLYSKFLDDRIVKTIYFGGGTPSLMNPIWIEEIVEKIYSLFSVALDVEITLEVNPKTVNLEKLKCFYQAGINRLSVGIQSLNDEELKFLGRIHNVKDALQTLDYAKKYFSNVSSDFIYALPNQTLENWGANLEKIKQLKLNHLSLYQLIIEPKTPLYNSVKQHKVNPIDDRVAIKMFEYTNRVLKSSLPQYEISNYAKKGFESKHNLNYWNGGDYVGIGVNAAGRIVKDGKIYITENPKQIEQWIKNVDALFLPLKILSKRKRAEELLIMGLRKNKGINFNDFSSSCFLDFFDVVDRQKFENFVNNKYLIMTSGGVRVSVKGRNVLDSVIREIAK